jgi:5-carboxymethyl-2-hydroxymuconate isomerase
MPHIVLQYSANITPVKTAESLFAEIHSILNKVGGINLENCKSRLVPCSNYLIGEGSPDSSFVSVEIRFLEGRSDDIKSELGKAILEATKLWCGEAPARQITVEIGDIRKNEYFKSPEGTFSKQ